LSNIDELHPPMRMSRHIASSSASRTIADRQQRTILHGASYGDLVGAKLIETYAKNPDGSFNFDATER